MKIEKILFRHLNIVSTAALAVLLVGCQSAPQKSASEPTPAPAASAAPETPAAVPAVAAAPAAAPAPAISLPLRIDAGATEGFTDNQGNKWLPDQGFADGDTIERPDISITNAADPRIYQSEHYSMTKFTQALPNGKYIVKLDFCETYDGITGPGDRVFSFNVAGQHEFKDFDVWVKADGPFRAYVETVPVEITDGKLEITFTPNVENPQINGIEIVPAM